MDAFVKSDWSVFQQALIYTVTVQAVNSVVANREGSVLTLCVTTALMTYAAQVLQTTLATNEPEHRLAKPLARAAAFVAATMVSVGINMQSTLIGTYFGQLFDSSVHPIFILASSIIGLVLLWTLGVVVGAV